MKLRSDTKNMRIIIIIIIITKTTTTTTTTTTTNKQQHFRPKFIYNSAMQRMVTKEAR